MGPPWLNSPRKLSHKLLDPATRSERILAIVVERSAPTLTNSNFGEPPLVDLFQAHVNNSRDRSRNIIAVRILASQQCQYVDAKYCERISGPMTRMSKVMARTSSGIGGP